MWSRILAVLIARNREFYRDKAGLGWNVFMPVFMILAMAFIFGAGPRPELKIGVVTDDGYLPKAREGLLALRYVEFIPYRDPAPAIAKVERHRIDLLVDLRQDPPLYWVNSESPKGYLAERLLLGASRTDPAAAPERRTLNGRPLSYADWVLPGVLAMNLMFSSLWGVGWVVVRYRKNGVLRRLKATPLSPFEFLAAQVGSRLLVTMGASAVVFVGAKLLIQFPMRGSYLALVLVYGAGALCVIGMGLIVSSRLRTEELADGILNLISWPMMLLSGIWFSMEGASPGAQLLSRLSPLTHLVDAARAIMLDGAGLAEVLPQILLLLALAAAFLALAARLFRWE
jgi:ABC-2 type transport system permease protein